MDYRDNRQRWAESHQVVHFYAGQWCTFTPALTVALSTDEWTALVAPMRVRTPREVFGSVGCDECRHTGYRGPMERECVISR